MFTVEEMKKKYQENSWLKVDGADFEDDPFMEWDYDYILKFRDGEHTNKEYIIQSRKDYDKAMKL
ncbi:hypothetical protein ABEY69_25205 [Priestia filamentosa]|uniref:hypothetical protein n=1 Tax=Priestia filamentosa TaxID=1402861 RepID=UPI003D2CE5D3